VSAPVEPRNPDLGQTITAKAETGIEIPIPSTSITSADAVEAPPVSPPSDERPRGRSRLADRADAWLQRQRPLHWLIALVVIAVAIGGVLRFITSAHIWLDEALTVEISSRHLPQLFTALRHDGSPPLYYLMLQFWMDVFGRSDVAIRALSGVLSLGSLPLAWYAGRRVARVAASFGHIEPHAVDRTGTAVLLLFATSPYMIRYGTETRMYSLVVFLVLLFAVVLARALEQPSLRRWSWVTLTTAALAYTHYWTFLMLASVAFFLLLQARRRRHYRKLCLQALYAMLAASVLFLPWAPTFAYQMLHTGTPWAQQVHAEVLLDTVFSWAGPASAGALLALVLLLMAFIGYSARPSGDGLHMQLSGRVPGRYLVAMWLVPLVLAYGTYAFGGSAYAERYTGIALPPFLLLAGLGIGLLPSRTTVTGLLALVSVLGLLGGRSLNGDERTNAVEVATRIQQQARPGDVVGYCPDQLAPAVHRMLVKDKVSGVQEVAFADPSEGPALVDWVDYAKRMKAASATAFAQDLDKMAGPDGSIYLVSADGYRTLGDDCSEVADQLSALGRDPVVQVGRRSLLESGTLTRFSTKR
jgi:mannosyltransferase